MANFNEHQLNGNRLILLVLGRFFEHIMYRNSVWLRTLPVIFGFLLYLFIFFGMKITYKKEVLFGLYYLVVSL